MPDSIGVKNILDVLKRQRAIDFSGYKAGTLMRRIDLRLLYTAMPDYAAYHHYLSEHPAEIDLLLDSLTITVSHFFRDPLVFEILRESVIPDLTEPDPPGGLRIWCAGCARGEEPYSLSILIREGCPRETKRLPAYILASDIDKPALAFAAQGRYPVDSLAEVKKAYLDAYFYADGYGFRVKDEIRSPVTFVRHDITSCHPPKEGVFSDYHLIMCRNTLIYFNRELGEQITSCLARSLVPGGYLVLGKAESIPTDLMREFQEIFPRTRIYRKGV